MLTRIDTGNSTDFYPRSPCGERPVTTLGAGSVRDFYPRSPCGERRLLNSSWISSIKFLSTLSLRRATTVQIVIIVMYALFLSTLSLRRATEVIAAMTEAQSISIHALLAESDCQWRRSVKLFRQFLSTLSLRRATRLMYFWLCGLLFLSTLSLRRATVKLLLQLMKVPLFLSTLSLRRATLRRNADCSCRSISIHALLAESDGGCGVGNWRLVIFLSTLSLRRATAAVC